MSFEQEIILHPFAAGILKHLKNEEVEIYCGDVKTTLQFHDYNVQQKNVIRGFIKDAIGDAIIVECEKSNKKGIVFLNVWSIKAIIKIKDSLFIADIFEDEEENLKKNRNKK